ncbi:MAG: Ribosomal RNA small subunit methyltransferase E [Clostridiales bacterium 38_11]|nr:MAG: Ribosomal RNA small subunit methyltransferase E [Clostridiales bacterium 38_11]
MNRFFVDEINDGQARIKDADFKHCKNVLRLKEGSEIFLVYNSREYIGKILSYETSTALCTIVKESEKTREAGIDVSLYQCIPKSSKMETIIQKNVEIGVNRIVPVISYRTIVKISEQAIEEKKLIRWNKVSEEAAKQSMRNIIPKVDRVITFKQMIENLRQSKGLIIVPYENESDNNMGNIRIDCSDVRIVIGPEGGFEEFEIEELKNAGAHIVTLGPRILRTETAGIVACAICMYKTNNI